MDFVNQQITTMRVLNPSSPAVVVYKDDLYLFGVSGPGDAPVYIVQKGKQKGKQKGEDWSPSKKLSDLHIGIAAGTSPCCAVYNNSLYLFYCGTGNDGIYYTVFNGSDWTAIVPIPGSGFLPSTSPSAVVHDKTLYVFWNGSGNDGIWFSKFNRDWSPQENLHRLGEGLGIAKGTSPAACSFNKELYVFYNGVGNDGTFFMKLNGDHWDNVVSVSREAAISGMGFASGTSPAACVMLNGAALALFWARSGNAGIWYTTLDTKGWQAQQQLTCPNATPGILPSTTPAVTVFQNVPRVFWNGSGNDGIHFTNQLYDTLSTDTYASIIDAMHKKRNFLVIIEGDSTISALQRLVPSLPGQKMLGDNSALKALEPNTNPKIPSNRILLSDTHITILAALGMGLLGFVLSRYRRARLYVQAFPPRLILDLVSDNNNNNPAPNQIELLEEIDP